MTINTKANSTFTSATEHRRLDATEMLKIGIAAALHNAEGTPTIVIENPPLLALPPPAVSNVVQLPVPANKNKGPATKAKKTAKTKATKAKTKPEAPTPGKRRLASGKVIDVPLPRRYKRTLKDGTVQWVGPAYRGYASVADALADTTNFVGGINPYIKIGEAA